MCDKSKCSCKKKASQASSSVQRKLEEEYTKFASTPSDSLLKKYLTREVFDKLKVGGEKKALFCAARATDAAAGLLIMDFGAVEKGELL